MSARIIRGQLKQLINFEKEKINHIKKLLDHEQPSLQNARYLKLIARSSYHQNRIDSYFALFKKYRKRVLVRNAFVNANSKVKLVSTKIGATIWVDARNYVDLLGKSIGDIVLMHNSTFQIAGIY